MNEITTIFESLKPMINTIIKNSMASVLKREQAIVLSADNTTGHATVRLLSSPDESSQYMTLPNITGQKLYQGQTVYVDRWGYPTFDAVIAATQVYSTSLSSAETYSGEIENV